MVLFSFTCPSGLKLFDLDHLFFVDLHNFSAGFITNLGSLELFPMILLMVQKSQTTTWDL